MRHRKMLRNVGVAAALSILVAIGVSWAIDTVTPLFNRQFEVVGKTADIIEFRYTTAPNPGFNKCTEYRVYVEPSEGLEVLGPSEWNSITVDKPFDEVLRLKIAKGDTCSLKFAERSDCGGGGALVYFISIADSIEVHYGKIRAADPRSSGQKQADYWQALLSERQLDYEYDIEMSIGTRGSAGQRRLKTMDSLVGPLTPTDREFFYNARVTRRQMLQLLRWNVGFNRISAEYPDVQRIIDSIKAAAPPPPTKQRTLSPLATTPMSTRTRFVL